MKKTQPQSLHYRNITFNKIYIANPPSSTHYDEYMAMLDAESLECKAPRTNSLYLNFRVIQIYASKNKTQNILVLLQVDQWNQRIIQFLNDKPENLFVFAIPLPSLGRQEKVITGQRSIIQYVPSDTTKSELKFKQGAHLTRILDDWVNFSKASATPLPSQIEDTIDGIDNQSTKPRLISLNSNIARFDLYFHPRKGSNRLAVLHQSAISRSTQDLPIFHRWKWSQDLPAHAIVLNDPTLFLSNKLNCGWWLGEKAGHSFMSEFNKILITLMNRLEIDEKDLFIYGASAGGFSALRMGLEFPNSNVVVDIPQTNLLRYQQHKEVDNVIQAIYGAGSSRSTLEVAHKLDLCEAYTNNQYIPNIVYIQNDLDTHHVDQQMVPFMDSLAMQKCNNAAFFGTYSLRHSTRGGHTPLPRRRTTILLEYVINRGIQGINEIYEALGLTKILLL